MTLRNPLPARRECRRCQATGSLRLEDSITIWNEAMVNPQQLNIYVCVDRKACSERVGEVHQFIKEPELWKNYHKDCRSRRYTPRKYWNDGRRLTFAIAQVLFLHAQMTLEKGQPGFPHGLKSGYIINRTWRYTSLLEAIKLVEAKPQKAKRPCRHDGL